MKFTDIFIQRPVLATVISILIFIFGLRGIFDLPIRQFPKLDNTVITVSTGYSGADAKLIQNFITTPIEKAMAGADGIDYLTATSSQGSSSIKAHIKLNFNPDKAFTNIMSKVAEVRGQLPKGSDQPVIHKDTGARIALMYLSFSSSRMSPEQITDYISRVVQPKLETITGVANAEMLGDKSFAMRIWLNPHKMAALNVTAQDIAGALSANNIETTAGRTKGKYVSVTIHADTGLHTAKQFQEMIVKNVDGTLIRLKDIADVKLGSVTYDDSVTFNGKQAIFIGVTATPSANPLTVIKRIRKVLPDIKSDFPPSLDGKIVYDATQYIRAALHEVIRTIIEATAIVVVVIFLFLGALRSVLIPIITIPLSLVGVCALLLILGYSLNLMTLLAMILAIGLVVDDAIVVVENIHRHIEEGMAPKQAAIAGAREIMAPIITMTITLAAVYTPIGFMGGLTGALFKEFAFTLACTVLISGLIALTLSPMMCANILTQQMSEQGFVHWIDNFFNRVKEWYAKRLHSTLNYRPVTLVMAVTILLSCFYLYTHTQKALAPEEDQGALWVMSSAPEYANIDYVTKFTDQFNKIFQSIPERQDYFIINGVHGVNSAMAGFLLKPWDQRKRKQAAIKAELQPKLSHIAGLNTFIFPLPPIPTSEGPGLQFVLTTTSDHQLLYPYVQRLLSEAKRSGLFMFVDSSLKYNKPEYRLTINRAKAAEVGLTMQSIGSALATALGGGYVNRFSMQGRSYYVIPQVARQFRAGPDNLKSIYLKTLTGEMIPLSTVTHFTRTTQPNNLSQFQQLNSATIQGMMAPGHTLADGLNFLQTKAKQILPRGINYDYGGQSRQFIHEGNTLIYTFFFALMVIYLVLAAQFESWRDPWIILISVPMSICGALIPLNLGAATINIYTQVGLITLIGLISKHGILMVDFANKLQAEQKLWPRDAIEQAAAIRLRPILMTTAAMVLGVMPLVLARGAGAASRFDMGLVIATGMLFGTLFTLFVVPTMYTLINKRQQPSYGQNTRRNESGNTPAQAEA